jgi:ligand-binding sensor domain-containing protein
MTALQTIRPHIYFSVLVIALFAKNVATAQWPVTYAVQNFPQACDISSRTFTYLHKGKEGFLWIGTREGLIRYDGYDFKLFKNAHGANNHILYITQDIRGVLWCILSNNTLCSFDNASQKFTSHHFIAKNPYWNEHLRLETFFLMH